MINWYTNLIVKKYNNSEKLSGGGRQNVLQDIVYLALKSFKENLSLGNDSIFKHYSNIK
jgi:hypothetical protein